MPFVKLVLAASIFAAGPALAADPRHPTLIELFESQGCSDCPPANANLNAIADRPDLLALNFAVTYWDQLGWKDTFATPGFTARQWAYAHAAGRGNVFTPQMIVNGRGVLVGSNRAQVEQAIHAYDRGTVGPAIARSGGKVLIGGGTARGATTVWVVYYDPRAQNVPIRAGENGGKTLPHRDVVRALKSPGSWIGGPITFVVPTAADPAYRTAILVQQGKGGPIIAAAKI